LVFRLLAFDRLDGHDTFQSGTDLFQGDGRSLYTVPRSLGNRGRRAWAGSGRVL